MPTMSYTITRGDEDIDVELEYEITPLIPAQTYGPPEHCYPAEGGEITEFSCSNAETGEAITLTDAEQGKAETFIIENHDFDDDGHDYDQDA